MYTELNIRCRIKQDIPQDVLDVLMYMFGGKEEPATLPNHTLFGLDRWRMIGRSYYFSPYATSSIHADTIGECYFVCSNSIFKNYCGEVQAFFDWIMPYVDETVGDKIGSHQYEEFTQPTYVKKV